jgi:UDP-glucose 4-epimerase
MSVIALDSLLEGHRAAVPPGAVFCQADLGDRSQLEKVFTQHKIDAVMHFAAEALVAKSVREPSIFYATNVACGVNLLDAVTRHGVKKFIFSSTAATYGEPETVPIPEDHPKAPINPYGKSKLVFEQILADYKTYTQLNYVSLRYFNAAGASRERSEQHRVETHLIPRVLDAASGGLPHVDVFGTDYPTPDGTCVRDYVHIVDLATAHLAALGKIQPGQGLKLNLGTGRGYSVREVIDVCRKVTGHPIPAVIGPRRAGDPPSLIADARLANKTLGWTPRYPTIESIVETAWRWHQSHPRGYAS